MLLCLSKKHAQYIPTSIKRPKSDGIPILLTDGAMEFSGAKPDEFINHDTIDTKLSSFQLPRNSQEGFRTEDEFELPPSSINGSGSNIHLGNVQRSDAKL